jgi:hypothetical protein
MERSTTGQSEADSGIPVSVGSLAAAMVEIGRRGLRLTLGRAVPSEPAWNSAVGIAAVAGGVVAHGVNAARGLAGPVVRIALRPPVLPPAWQPIRLIETLQERGQRERASASRAVDRTLDILLPLLVEQVLSHIDLNALVKEHLDIEAIVADLDLDAVVDRVDIDKVAGRLDLDAVLDRIDLNAVVRERVDLNAIVGTVDIAAVIDRIDFDVLAQQVIDTVDLPEIIRDSTGSVASEAVRGVRMQSIEADDAIARAIDRIFRRNRNAPTSPANGGSPGSDGQATISIRVPPAKPSQQ